MLVLALGIGLVTALFSVLDGVLLRGLPFRDGDRIVMVSTRGDNRPMPVEDLQALRERQQSLETMAGFLTLNSVLSHPQRGSSGFTATYVTGELFSMLGAEPLLGRAIVREDEDPRSPQIVVLSHGLWQRMFDADPGILGESVVLNREPATIVGVMPPGFQFPVRQGAWSAFRFAGHPWSTAALFAIARLPPQGSVETAELALTPHLAQLDEESPLEQPRQAWVRLYTEAMLSEELQRALHVMLWAGLGLLLIACANTASLRLADALEREGERSVRSALGASRPALVRQLLAEAVVLIAAGTATGIGLAWLLTDLASRWLLAGSSLVRRFWIDVRLDSRSLLFALVAGSAAVVLGGVLPALWSSRPSTLVTGTRASAATLAVQRAVVGIEVAISFALLVGTGVLIEGALSLLRPHLNFEPAGLRRALVVQYQAFTEPDETRAFWTQALEALRARPEIEGVTLASTPPWSNFGQRGRVRSDNNVDVPAHQLPSVSVCWVLPGTFGLLRLPLLRGRDFSATDGHVDSFATGQAEVPVVVSETFARRHLDGMALEQSFELVPSGWERPLRARVIGVVADLGLARDQEPGGEELVYLPMTGLGAFLMVRARAPTADLSRIIDQELSRANPRVASLAYQSFEEERGEDTWIERRLVLLFSVFGAVAIVFSAVGFYGVLSQLVRRRERELGIRAAIGALPRQLAALVLREGGKTLAIGLLLGSVLVFQLARQLGPLSLGVEGAQRSLAIAVATAVVVGCALVASLGPARRVARTDPAGVLRRV